MELRHYYEVLRKRFWVIALLTIVVVSGVVFQTTSLTPKYEAEVNMLVTPRVTAPTAFEDTGPSVFPGGYREAVLRNIALLIQSREVLQRVADRIGGTSAAGLRGRVQVTEVRGSDFLLIKAKHDVPERAALIANTVAQEFVNYYTQINRADASGAQKFIEEQLGLAKGRLRASEGALLAFKSQSGVVDLPREASGMVQRILDLDAARETAALEERMAQSRVEAIQERLRTENDARLATVSIATNPVVGQLRTHLTQLELELAASRQANTDEHPKVKELLGRIADGQQRLKEEAVKIASGESLGVSPIREHLVREMVMGEVAAVTARARATGLTQIRVQMQGKQRVIPENELTLARLQRDVRIAEESYVRLSALHQETAIRESKAGASGQAGIVLVDLAQTPELPVSDQLPIKAAFAGLLGLVAGAALALVLDSMDDRIQSPRQAEGAYGIPVLAAIPVISAGNHRHLTHKPAPVGLRFFVIFLLIGASLGAGLAFTRADLMPDAIVRLTAGLVQTLPTLP
jgi:uncharacterized protein involved in exopolysaccharide biosynthesis